MWTAMPRWGISGRRGKPVTPNGLPDISRPNLRPSVWVVGGKHTGSARTVRRGTTDAGSNGITGIPVSFSAAKSGIVGMMIPKKKVKQKKCQFPVVQLRRNMK